MRYEEWMEPPRFANARRIYVIDAERGRGKEALMRYQVVCVVILIVALYAPVAYGQLAPICQVTPTVLDFGTVSVGGHEDATFTIENIGTGQLKGTVSEACNHYSIVSGGGAYKLGAGESVTVTVRFEPMSTGTQVGAVETGLATCSNVNLTGVGAEVLANEPAAWGRIKALFGD